MNQRPQSMAGARADGERRRKDKPPRPTVHEETHAYLERDTTKND